MNFAHKSSTLSTKYKGTDDLTPPYREFEFNWLESCDEELVKSVKIEFDCIRNKRVWGDGIIMNIF